MTKIGIGVVGGGYMGKAHSVAMAAVGAVGPGPTGVSAAMTGAWRVSGLCVVGALWGSLCAYMDEMIC